MSVSVYNGKGQQVERTQELLNPALSSIDQDAYAAGEGYSANGGAGDLPAGRAPGTSLFWGAYWHMQTPLQNVDSASVVLLELRDGAQEQDSAVCYWARYPLNFTTITTTSDEAIALSPIQNSHSAASRKIMLTGAPSAAPAANNNARPASTSSKGGGPARAAELRVDCVLHQRERNVTLEQVVKS